MESHVFSEPIPVLTADRPTWRIEIRRKLNNNNNNDNAVVVVGTLVIDHDNFPPRRKSAQGKILWKLPDTMETTPRFGDHEKKRLWELFKKMKKERRKQQQKLQQQRHQEQQQGEEELDEQQQQQSPQEPVENKLMHSGKTKKDAPPSSKHNSLSQESDAVVPPPPGFTPPPTMQQTAPPISLNRQRCAFWIPADNNPTIPSFLLAFQVANAFEQAMNFHRDGECSQDFTSKWDNLDAQWMRYYYNSTNMSINHANESSPSRSSVSSGTTPSHTIMMGTAQAHAHGFEEIQKQWRSLVSAPDSSNVGGWQISNQYGTVADESSAVVVLTGRTHQPTTGCLSYTLTVVLKALSDGFDRDEDFHNNDHTPEMQSSSSSQKGTAYSIIHTILTMCAMSPHPEGTL